MTKLSGEGEFLLKYVNIFRALLFFVCNTDIILTSAPFRTFVYLENQNFHSNNVFKLDAFCNTTKESHSPDEDNSALLKKIVQQYNGNIIIQNEDDYNEVLRLCSTDYVTLSKTPLNQLSENLNLIETQIALVKKKLNAWCSVKESLEREVNVHNLSIKTLIQLNRNSTRKQK